MRRASQARGDELPGRRNVRQRGGLRRFIAGVDCRDQAPQDLALGTGGERDVAAGGGLEERLLHREPPPQRVIGPVGLQFVLQGLVEEPHLGADHDRMTRNARVARCRIDQALHRRGGAEELCRAVEAATMRIHAARRESRLHLGTGRRIVEHGGRERARRHGVRPGAHDGRLEARVADLDAQRVPRRLVERRHHGRRHGEHRLEVDRVEALDFVEANLGIPGVGELHDGVVAQRPREVERARHGHVGMSFQIKHAGPPGACATTARSRTSLGQRRQPRLIQAAEGFERGDTRHIELRRRVPRLWPRAPCIAPGRPSAATPGTSWPRRESDRRRRVPGRA